MSNITLYKLLLLTFITMAGAAVVGSVLTQACYNGWDYTNNLWLGLGFMVFVIAGSYLNAFINNNFPK